MSPENIIQIPIQEAMDYKYKLGVDEYRGGDSSVPFVGDPVCEMYSEIIDALIYDEEAREQGFPLYKQVNEILMNLATVLKEYKEINP